MSLEGWKVVIVGKARVDLEVALALIHEDGGWTGSLPESVQFAVILQEYWNIGFVNRET